MASSGPDLKHKINVSGPAGAGAPDFGRSGKVSGQALAARELAAREHFVTPSNDSYPLTGDRIQNRMAEQEELLQAGMPYYMNNYDGIPVAYDGPSAQKENIILRSAIRDAANKEIRAQTADGQAPGVIRTEPIHDEEVAYLKSMKDQTELAKFDEYVESFIDPRQPGNMKWLMEIYPDYVNRRLQQAHTDYEFALRNQMIDSWGINTFDDLHFKYLVDQRKLNGPALRNDRPPVDSSYSPGWLSPWNFQSPYKGSKTLALPFNSAKHGRRPDPGGRQWTRRRNGPLSSGNTEQELARGMYALPEAGEGQRLPIPGNYRNDGGDLGRSTGMPWPNFGGPNPRGGPSRGLRA